MNPNKHKMDLKLERLATELGVTVEHSGTTLVVSCQNRKITLDNVRDTPIDASDFVLQMCLDSYEALAGRCTDVIEKRVKLYRTLLGSAKDRLPLMDIYVSHQSACVVEGLRTSLNTHYA